MGIMTLPYGNDSDVHLSSEEVIDLIRKFNPLHYENGFIGTAAQYIEQEMEPLGLESAWIWLNPHGSLFSREIYEKESQHIYKISKKYENLYPFGWLTYFENEGTDRRKDRIRKFYDEYGFCGLKINIEDVAYTKFKKFRLTDTFLGPELDFLTHHYPEKPVLFHTGINIEKKRAHPELVGNLAKKYSDLNFVMVHTGACPGAINNDYHMAAIAVMEENKNVFGILSMINPASVFDVYLSIKNGVIDTDQILVGSDYPYNKAIGTVDSRYNLACHPELQFSETQIKKIMTENAGKLIHQGGKN